MWDDGSGLCRHRLPGLLRTIVKPWRALPTRTRWKHASFGDIGQAPAGTDTSPLVYEQTHESQDGMHLGSCPCVPQAPRKCQPTVSHVERKGPAWWQGHICHCQDQWPDRGQTISCPVHCLSHLHDCGVALPDGPWHQRADGHLRLGLPKAPTWDKGHGQAWKAPTWDKG